MPPLLEASALFRRGYSGPLHPPHELQATFAQRPTLINPLKPSARRVLYQVILLGRNAEFLELVPPIGFPDTLSAWPTPFDSGLGSWNRLGTHSHTAWPLPRRTSGIVAHLMRV